MKRELSTRKITFTIIAAIMFSSSPTSSYFCRLFTTFLPHPQINGINMLQRKVLPNLSFFVISAAAFSTQPRRFYKKKNKNSDKEDFRADRVLANRSGKSRSECHDLLIHKRIWMRPSINKNNEDEAELTLVSGPSARLPMNAALFIDGVQEVPYLPPQDELFSQSALLIYHKPVWVLSVTNDPKYQRPCLDNTVVPSSYHPVGRLDYDTSGLLLFSNIGALTQNILHPKQSIEKEYVATVLGMVDRDELSAKLQAGVQTTMGIHTAVLLDSQVQDDPTSISNFLKNIIENLPYNKTELAERGYLKKYEPVTHTSTVRLIVTEGKHRMVRRMLANCGHPVISLHRERIGEICLGDLPVGEQRECQEHERQWARSLIQEQTGKKKKYKPNRTKAKPQ